MAPARNNNEGERIASLEAKFDGYEKYSHDRWHDLNNDLQVLIGLPGQLARDIAKLEGRLDAKIDGRLSAIETRLSAIEAQRQQFTGAKQFAVWMIQTFLAFLAVLAAMRSGLGK